MYSATVHICDVTYLYACHDLASTCVYLCVYITLAYWFLINGRNARENTVYDARGVFVFVRVFAGFNTIHDAHKHNHANTFYDARGCVIVIAFAFVFVCVLARLNTVYDAHKHKHSL